MESHTGLVNRPAKILNLPSRLHLPLDLKGDELPDMSHATLSEQEEDLSQVLPTMVTAESPSKKATENVRTALAKVLQDALISLNFRDLVYYEPFEKEWKCSITNGDIIHSAFGEVTFLKFQSKDGVAVCRHKDGKAFINGYLIEKDSLGNLIVRKTQAPVIVEIVKEESLEELPFHKEETLRCSTIDLRGACVDNYSAGKIAEGIYGNYLIQTLQLSGNQIGDAGAQLLSKALSSNAHLTDLSLSYNSIALEGSNAIVAAVATHRALRHLDLSYNTIGAHGATNWLGDSLRQNSVLETLKLSHNDIGEANAIPMLKALEFHSTSTKEQIKLQLMKRLSSNPGDLAKKRSNISVLLISDIGLADAAALALVSVLRSNTNLKKLDISSNRFTENGMENIVEGMEGNRSLEHFNCSFNIFGEESVCRLAKAIASHPTLKTLLMSNCFKPSCKAAQEMAHMLAKNKSLTSLDMAHCIMELPGINDFSMAVGLNQSLTSLNLENCGFASDATLALLAPALAGNPRLTAVDLGHNKLTLRGVKLLGDALTAAGGHSRLALDATLQLPGNSGRKDKHGVVAHGGLLASATPIGFKREKNP